MNAITQHAGEVASWQPPALSQGLQVLVNRQINPHPGDFGERVSVPMHIRAEAERHLRAFEAACRPAGRGRLHRWLLVVNASVRNPVSPGKPYDDAVDGFVLCAELPAIAMTGATQRMAALEWDMWPSQKELYGWLQAQAAPIVRTRDALRRIMAGEEPTPEITPEERAAAIAHVTAQVAALRADLRAQEEAREARYPKAGISMARPLSPQHLAIARERAGIRAG